MKIGIIGAGNIGGNLARRLGPLGHEVRIANSRGPETLAELAAVEGVTPVEATEAAEGAEVVIVTIPLVKVQDLPDDILDGAADGAVVIDTNNYYPQQRDGRIDAIEDGQTESQYVAEQLGRPVVKVFNGVYAQRILDVGEPDGPRFAIPVAGDDPETKVAVSALVAELGFEPVDAGELDESWRQQPGTPAYGLQADADGLREALAAASPERTAEWKA
ncbi:NADPH-dependent F420 reductase [Patulibacter sp.]|uniref:NADPH-dependent F420 reductase n=1 Tax=Patulibacter sp. TaxID=1912859 RepID=UPI0027244530|nr:NAD(P)-binding domain-containing protein [Patulibacter sp.]MDO9409902.1 NAD(P)-binding domain-containing protein [Patulibacter sp.]